MDQRGSDPVGGAALSGAAGLDSMLSGNGTAGPDGSPSVGPPRVSHRGPGLPAWPGWLKAAAVVAGAALAVAVLAWAGGDARTGAASTPGAVVAGEPADPPPPVTVTAPAGVPRGYTGIPVTVVGPSADESASTPSESREPELPGVAAGVGAAGAPVAPGGASDLAGRGGGTAGLPGQPAPPDRPTGPSGGGAPPSGGSGPPSHAPSDPPSDPVPGPGPSEPGGSGPTDPPEPPPADRPVPQGPPSLPPGLVDNPAEPQPPVINRAF